MTLTLLLCNQPAALQVTLFNTVDTIILNETINSTTTLMVSAFGIVIPLMVTVDHLTNAIGIMVKCGVHLY